MADDVQQTIRGINWREVFPFLHLFRAFRVAVHPSKLLLALAGLVLIYLGGRVLDGVWPDSYLPPEPTAFVSVEDIVERPAAAQSQTAGGPRDGIFITFYKYQVLQINNVVFEGVLKNNWHGQGDSVFESVLKFITVGPAWLFSKHVVYAILFAAWFLLIWSVFGGAVARIAAVHVARDEKISIRQALRFSINKLLSFTFAPLIPLLIVLVIAGIVAAVSWILLHVPWVGPIVLGLLFVLTLLAGFVMTLVLLGTVGGFNLMYPTIAVEGSDSFDAISRSFSYVFARPWRMLFYTVVAVVYGALSYLFVRVFIWLVLAVTHFSVGWWLTGQPRIYWHGIDGAPSIWPTPDFDRLPYDVDYGRLKLSEDIAAGAISFWVYLVIALLGAFAISFYFSANTIIYYLMRREVDATEMDDVYVEETEDEFGEPAPVTAADADATPAPAAGATSAPGGGVTGTAGSADPGGGAVRSYEASATDAPPARPAE